MKNILNIVFASLVFVAQSQAMDSAVEQNSKKVITTHVLQALKNIQTDADGWISKEDVDSVKKAANNDLQNKLKVIGLIEQQQKEVAELEVFLTTKVFPITERPNSWVGRNRGWVVPTITFGLGAAAGAFAVVKLRKRPTS